MATTKTVFKNEVFEIISKHQAERATDVDIYFKGNPVAFDDIDIEENAFCFEGNPDIFLDFKAAQFPADYHFTLELDRDRLHDFVGIVSLHYNKKQLTLDYFICFCNSQKEKMDLNPYKLLLRMFALLKKKGYRMADNFDHFTENGSTDIYVELEPGDNVLKAFNKHLKVFEKTYQQAEQEILKRLHRK
jgi:hypothetical protein